MKTRSLWIRLLLCVLPLFIGLALWNRLPASIPTHWNAEGVIDGYSSRAFAVLFFPLFFTGMELLVSFALKSDPKNHNQDRFMYELGLWVLPVMSVVVMVITYASAFGMHVPVNVILMTLVGVLFIFLGNQMPKTRQNYTIGIKVPWTLNSERNWNLTHRMAGPLWVIGGLVMILTGFLGNSTVLVWVMLAVIFVLAFVPMIYSYLLYKKGI